MRKGLFITILSFFAYQLASGQVVQWANKVIDFSSELTSVQYSAQQILGKPNVMPAVGQNPNAWTPDRPKRKEWIKIGYENPMQIQQVAIAESNNPGALYRILAYEENGTEHVLQTLNPQAIPTKGRMLNIFIEKTSFKVASLKLEFDGAPLPDYFSIDAVAITDSRLPIAALVNVSEMIAKGLLTDRLDENVNSEYKELNAILSPDGQTLYFSRRNHPGNLGGVNDKEDIWFSTLDKNGKWTLAQNMGAKFNNEHPNFINSINSVTPDGKAAVMVLGNQYINGGKKMLAGMSISNYVNGEWTAPKSVKIENDYNYNEKSHYFLTNTRNALLMSVEREDSYGDRDLYVSFSKNDSTWSEPLNLGKTVNTASEEEAPFLAADNKTLYFSSKGFSGYGGSDLYRSIRLDDTWTKWSEPENLGPEINSKFDDLFFNIPSNSDFGYFSKGVADNNVDIFRLKLPPFMLPDPVVLVKGKLIDQKTGLPIGSKIIFETLPDGKEAGIAQSDPQTGEYEIQLPVGKQYGIRAEAKDHLSTNQNLDLRKIAYGPVKQDLALVPIGAGDKPVVVEPIEITPIAVNVIIPLNNIFFDFDKASLRSESFSELNRIVALMAERKSMTVEISGYTDNLGPDAYNMKLSERRAKSVSNYLVEKGVDSSRITTTWFGETKPVDTTNTKAGNRKNRRVEFKILKMP
ncbi:MAG: OmpA family protein [Chryseotalea sp. WA131a]|jgi:outer membrane protein OmpA-like peptidoglycan-associated protein|nr:MAG: OmpA family protein [Chryseotalea sp. WA131a]